MPEGAEKNRLAEAALLVEGKEEKGKEEKTKDTSARVRKKRPQSAAKSVLRTILFLAAVIGGVLGVFWEYFFPSLDPADCPLFTDKKV